MDATIPQQGASHLDQSEVVDIVFVVADQKPRHFDSQPKVRSTTQRCALRRPGQRFSRRSLPMARIWGTWPWRLVTCARLGCRREGDFFALSSMHDPKNLRDGLAPSLDGIMYNPLRWILRRHPGSPGDGGGFDAQARAG